MAKVKAVKAVTEVTLALTGDEAEALKGILLDRPWDGTEQGNLAEQLHDALDDAGIA